MGFNTVAFFLNDMSDEIERSPVEVARKLRSAMAGGMGAKMGQAMEVLPSVHADGDQVIMAGGNRITPLAVLSGCDHTEEGLMRALAKRLGYSVAKKPAPPPAHPPQARECRSVEHVMLPDGESTEKWAIHGFSRTVDRLLMCARCGNPLRGGYNEPRHYRDVCKPTIHCLCGDCYNALPE